MTSEHFNTAGRDVKTGLTASVSPNFDPLLLPLQPPQPARIQSPS